MTLVYVIEDDTDQRRFLSSCLQQAGYSALEIGEPHAFFKKLNEIEPGIVLLDWNLPQIDGLTILRDLRKIFKQQMPVMMLSSRSAEEDIIIALNAGADDYIVKPVSPPVLLARLRALQRRTGARDEPRTTLSLGPFRLDYSAQSVMINQRSIALSGKEFDVLWKLIDAHDRFVSKTELTAAVWGNTETVSSHTLAQHMHSIRNKCSLAVVGFRIASVYGAGYRLESPRALSNSATDDGKPEDALELLP
jgi:DNA-binding response OmpR family regulator